MDGRRETGCGRAVAVSFTVEEAGQNQAVGPELRPTVSGRRTTDASRFFGQWA